MSEPQKKKSSTWETQTDAAIRQAMEEGHFANLAGAGRPLSHTDKPYEEDWWLKDFLKREGLSIPSSTMDIRIDVQRTMANIAAMNDESSVRQEIEKLNARIAKVNRTTISGPSTSVAVFDIEFVIARWKNRCA